MEGKEDDNCIKDENNVNRVDNTDELNDRQLNKKVVFSLKLILIGLSAVYLLYETIDLIKSYNNYNTLQTISYELKDEKEFPSFTLCLPTIIDKSKLLAKYPDLAQKLSPSLTEDKQRNILSEYLDTALDSVGVWTQLTIEDTDAVNCTLNYWSIKFTDESPIDYDKQRNGMNCRDIVKPIESYSYGKSKCFTYFSQLSAEKSSNGLYSYSLRDGVNNLNNILEIISIELVLDYDRYLTLAFIENETTIAIHNQRVIPNAISESQELEAGHRYEITINKVSTKLLEKPYKTQCSNYGKTNDGTERRQQCIDNCIINLYENKCNCSPIQFTTTTQLLNRSQTVCSHRDSSLRSNPCYDQIAQEVGLCLSLNRCPNDCQTIQYINRSKVKKLMKTVEEMDSNTEKKVVIKIMMDRSTGDTIVTHIPVITFGQLVSDISAFIAIFTGLSFIGCINTIINRMPAIPLSRVANQESDTVSTGRSNIATNFRLQEKASKWWTKKMRGKVQTDCVPTYVGSAKLSAPMGLDRRPASSTVYDNKIRV